MMNRKKLAKTNLTSHNRLTTGHYRSEHTHPSFCAFQDVGAANASIQGGVYQIFRLSISTNGGADNIHLSLSD